MISACADDIRLAAYGGIDIISYRVNVISLIIFAQVEGFGFLLFKIEGYILEDRRFFICSIVQKLLFRWKKGG